MSEFPGFPTLPAAPSTQKLPLTARATVSEASSSGMSAPAPVQVTTRPSNFEHRNKRDPLLTRLLYGFLAWASGNVPLEKGYSQVDWMRVMRGSSQPRPRRDITMEEVKQHRTREDAWMVFRNKVYNITPYMKFHPGGVDMLMKAAGRDGTSLFMKYHPWVNIDALMEKCFIGTLAEDTALPAGGPRLAVGAGGVGIKAENVQGAVQGAGQAAAGVEEGIAGGEGKEKLSVGKGELLPSAAGEGVEEGAQEGQGWQVSATAGPGSVSSDVPVPSESEMDTGAVVAAGEQQAEGVPSKQ